MAMICDKHRAVKSVLVCPHIAEAIHMDRDVPAFVTVQLDTNNMGKFFTPALLCHICIQIYGLHEGDTVSFLSLINEGNRVHFAAVASLQEVCEKCLHEARKGSV